MDKSSYEMVLDHYCQYCAFKLTVCSRFDDKCPAFKMNLMMAQMVEQAADNMILPMKAYYKGDDL